MAWWTLIQLSSTAEQEDDVYPAVYLIGLLSTFYLIFTFSHAKEVKTGELLYICRKTADS